MIKYFFTLSVVLNSTCCKGEKVDSNQSNHCQSLSIIVNHCQPIGTAVYLKGEKLIAIKAILAITGN